MDAPHIRAEARQLFLDVLVTAIQVINPLDQRLALGDEARDDQAGGGS